MLQACDSPVACSIFTVDYQSSQHPGRGAGAPGSTVLRNYFAVFVRFIGAA